LNFLAFKGWKIMKLAYNFVWAPTLRNEFVFTSLRTSLSLLTSYSCPIQSFFLYLHIFTSTFRHFIASLYFFTTPRHSDSDYLAIFQRSLSALSQLTTHCLRLIECLCGVFCCCWFLCTSLNALCWPHVNAGYIAIYIWNVLYGWGTVVESTRKMAVEIGAGCKVIMSSN